MAWKFDLFVGCPKVEVLQDRPAWRKSACTESWAEETRCACAWSKTIQDEGREWKSVTCVEISGEWGANDRWLRAGIRGNTRKSGYGGRPGPGRNLRVAANNQPCRWGCPSIPERGTSRDVSHLLAERRLSPTASSSSKDFGHASGEPVQDWCAGVTAFFDRSVPPSLCLRHRQTKAAYELQAIASARVFPAERNATLNCIVVFKFHNESQMSESSTVTEDAGCSG